MSLIDHWLLARRYPNLLRRFWHRSLDFSPLRRRFYEDYWQHATAAIGAEISPLGNNWYQISLNSRTTQVCFHYLSFDTYLSKRLADDKAMISKVIQDLGFRVPEFVEYDLRTMKRAHDFLEHSNQPCVVKPKTGSGGQGISTGVDGHRRLVEASLAASDSISLPILMLEEQISGESFRLLYLDGRLLHAVKRGRCCVTADGESSIRTLIERENERRLKTMPISSMNELRIDLDVKYTLADQDQDQDLRTVPSAGERVVVKNVANQNAKHDQLCVTERVHPDYHELAKKLLGRFGFRLIGVDVMSTDIGLSPGKTTSAINEINIPPGLHYHELVDNVSGFSDVGAEILDCVLNRAGHPLYTNPLLSA